MQLIDLANELIAANRENRVAALLKDHYADDAVSVEAMAMPPMMSAETVGRDAIAGKHAWWESAFTMHDVAMEGPFLHGDDRFAVIFEADATNNETGERMKMREVAVYHVKAGKIVREEFFYVDG